MRKKTLRQNIKPYESIANRYSILHFIFVRQMSIFSLLIDENENLKVLRSLRTLRALRPLRAISRWQGMRVSTCSKHLKLPERRSSNNNYYYYYYANCVPADSSERVNVRYPVHFQRLTGVSRVLADILDHGRTVLRRQIF